jgi:large subunit ribosomal protein L19
MSHLIIQALEKKFASAAGKKMPVLRPGYKVRVHQKIKEGEKERVQIFEGLVIALNAGHGASKTFTVRKEVEGVGVEKIFPVYSPNVVKIEIIKTFGVRRAKLYYLRGHAGVSNRLSAKLGLTERDEKHSIKNEVYIEEPAMVEEAAAPAADVSPEATPSAEQAAPTEAPVEAPSTDAAPTA